MRRPGRLAICLAAIACVSLIAASGAAAVSATPDEENLVRAYATVLMMRAQEDPVGDPCDTTEEQFQRHLQRARPSDRLRDRVGAVVAFLRLREDGERTDLRAC